MNDKISGEIMFERPLVDGSAFASHVKVVKRYRGELVNINYRYRNDRDQLAPEFRLSNEVRISCPSKYMLENYAYIRWIEVKKSKWTVSGIRSDGKNIYVSLGGPYGE